MGPFGAAVLELGCFGDSAYLLDYYYTHVVASRTVFFHLARMFFKKATVFLKKATNVVRLS